MSRPRGSNRARGERLWEIIRSYRRLGRTVLLTTHYLDEAERLCDRVAIVDRGKIDCVGTPRDLIVSLGGEHLIEFTLEEQNGRSAGPARLPDLEFLRRCPRCARSHTDHGRICLSVSEPHRALPALLKCLESRQLPLASLTTRHASLEDVFVKLAGQHLQDEEPQTS